MSGPTNPPTFLPKQPPILIGGAGTVLTTTIANAQVEFAAGGGTAERYSVVLASGTTNNLDPTGWPGSGLGARLLLDPSAGPATLTGLLAGNDGMLVLIWNIAAIGGNNITFNNLDAGSSAANQFSISGSTFILIPQARTVAVYDLDIGKWSIG